jgi:hypothetical protein
MIRVSCRSRAARTVLCVIALLPVTLHGQAASPPLVVGHWDLVAKDAGVNYPSWLEVSVSGNGTLVGRFVGRVGSARPIGHLEYANGVLRFAIPPQWEQGTADLRFEATLDGDRLTGTIVNPAGDSHTFVGSRAPSLRRKTAPVWDASAPLFNGKDLTGWTSQGAGESHWRVVNGVVTNSASGANLMTTRKFGDFKLHAEFRYPKAGNSGIYLRGRHEVQIEDSPEREWPASVHIGGVYGFLTPNENASTAPGEWQTYDITLIGRRLTVVLNGHAVIADQVIPGITGGALDSDEGAPGPLVLQGDHTAVEYRNVRLTPAKP